MLGRPHLGARGTCDVRSEGGRRVRVRLAREEREVSRSHGRAEDLRRVRRDVPRDARARCSMPRGRPRGVQRAAGEARVLFIVGAAQSVRVRRARRARRRRSVSDDGWLGDDADLRRRLALRHRYRRGVQARPSTRCAVRRSASARVRLRAHLRCVRKVRRRVAARKRVLATRGVRIVALRRPQVPGHRVVLHRLRARRLRSAPVVTLKHAEDVGADAGADAAGDDRRADLVLRLDERRAIVEQVRHAEAREQAERHAGEHVREPVAIHQDA